MTAEDTRASDTSDAQTPLDRLPGSWRELFGADHATASLVLAGGIAVYAMNTFVTAALLPSTIDDIGGNQYFAWGTTCLLYTSPSPRD